MQEEELFPLKKHEGYAITKTGKVWSYPKNKCPFNSHNGLFLNENCWWYIKKRKALFCP